MPVSSPPGRVGRPAELEDWLNRRIYHPLAGRLARVLQPTGVTPNMVSVAGGLLICAAAWAYTGLAWPSSVALGFLCHAGWHVLDGADGDLARLTGKSSPTGELVDGVCDYAGHVVLYVALAAFLAGTYGGWAWLFAILSGGAHIVQTNHAESQRRVYLWQAYGVPWLAQAQVAGDEVFRGHSWFQMVFGWMARDYLHLGRAMSPDTAAANAVFARAVGDPARTEALRAIVRAEAGTSLAYQNLVGPNPRALLLGISMAFGSPLWFFLAEGVGLSAVLVASMRCHRRHGRALVEKLTGALEPGGEILAPVKQSGEGFAIAVPALRLLLACGLLIAGPLFLGMNRLPIAWLAVSWALPTYLSCSLQGYRQSGIVALCAIANLIVPAGLYVLAFGAASTL